MAKHQFTQKTFQRETGEASGLYLFCDGMVVFAPLTREAVLKMTKEALKHGANGMVRCFEHMAMNATAPTTVPAASREGTHGAGSGKTE